MPLTLAISPERTPFGRNRWLQASLVVFAVVWASTLAGTTDFANWLLENTLVVLFLGFLVVHYRRHQFSDTSYLLICAFLCLHVYGSKYTYAENPLGFWLRDRFHGSRNHYDRIVHFSFGFLLAYPMRELFLKALAYPRWVAWLLPIEVTLSGSALYELVEWGVADVFFKAQGDAYLGTQGDIWDAQKDIALAVSGAILATTIVSALKRVFHVYAPDERPTPLAGARAAAGIAAVLLVGGLTACAGPDQKGTTAAATSSFAQMQVQVLDKSCALSGCHVAGSRNTPLVLTGGDVYARLVGAAPTNAAARADGLSLVDPGNPARSLLWHKLTVVPGHHSAAYGGAMPLGQGALSVEQVEFVRQWIERGAPRDGAVVPVALLSGTTPQSTAAYAPLAPPTAGAGFQLKLAPFPVSPTFEREFFSYQRVGNTDTAYVSRIELQMRSGSHHLIAYDFSADLPPTLRPAEGVLRDIRNPDGSQNLLNMLPMAWHVFLAGAQTPRSTYEFPAGVALRLPPNARLDLNSHYVNAGTKEIVGEAEVNLHTVPRSQVTKVAEALFLSNQQITIPAGRDTTIATTFRMTKATQVLMLSSHMHKRGIRFRIRWVGGARDGELLYDSDSWEHPAIVNFPVPLQLAAGEGLRSEVTYRGDATRVVRFGLTSEDEMGIIFGYAVAP